MSSTARTDALLISPFTPSEFSCSLQFFFHVVCQVLQRTTKEASEQSVMDLEQLDLIWCDSFPLSSSTLFPVKNSLARGQDWSVAIALSIWRAGSLRSIFSRDPVNDRAGSASGMCWDRLHLDLFWLTFCIDPESVSRLLKSATVLHVRIWEQNKAVACSQ